jgi:hypothetical protein
MKKDLLDRIVKIGVYMYQTLGFPLDLYNEKIESMSALEQLSFVNGFAERHKIIKPIFYKYE